MPSRKPNQSLEPARIERSIQDFQLPLRCERAGVVDEVGQRIAEMVQRECLFDAEMLRASSNLATCSQRGCHI